MNKTLTTSLVIKGIAPGMKKNKSKPKYSTLAFLEDEGEI